MAAADPIHVKCVAVGDGAVGKTCLLMTFATNTFPESYVPTIFENYCADCTVDGKKIALTLWDTAGQEDYDRLRPLSYPETDVVLICYSIDSQDPLDNVKAKWWPEIQHYIPGVPIVLVGTKSDLRTDEKAQQRLKAKGVTMVTQKQAAQLQKEIGAVVSGECSALTRDNVKHIFEEAVRFSLSKKTNQDSKNNSCCTIL